MDDSVVDLNSGHNTPKKPVLAPSHCGLPQGHWRLSCTRKKGGRSVFIDRSKGVTLNLQMKLVLALLVGLPRQAVAIERPTTVLNTQHSSRTAASIHPTCTLGSSANVAQILR